MYIDKYSNKAYDSPPDALNTTSYNIDIYSGTSCSGMPVQTLAATGTYSSMALSAGKYCVHLDTKLFYTPVNPVVTVNSGANTEVDFGFSIIQ